MKGKNKMIILGKTENEWLKQGMKKEDLYYILSQFLKLQLEIEQLKKEIKNDNTRKNT